MSSQKAPASQQKAAPSQQKAAANAPDAPNGPSGLPTSITSGSMHVKFLEKWMELYAILSPSSGDLFLISDKNRYAYCCSNFSDH